MCGHTHLPGTRGAADGHPEMPPSLPGAGRPPNAEPRAEPLPRDSCRGWERTRPVQHGGARRGSLAAADTAAQPAGNRRDADTQG